MKKYFLKFCAPSLLLFGFSATTLAHHSFVAHYLEGTEVAIKGIAQEFWFENPHARILVDVENEVGETERWIAETGAKNVFIRRGWDGTEIQPGDYVEIVGNASRDGSNTMYVVSLQLPNGQKYRTAGGGLQLDAPTAE